MQLFMLFTCVDFVPGKISGWVKHDFSLLGTAAWQIWQIGLQGSLRPSMGVSINGGSPIAGWFTL